MRIEPLSAPVAIINAPIFHSSLGLKSEKYSINPLAYFEIY